MSTIGDRGNLQAQLHLDAARIKFEKLTNLARAPGTDGEGQAAQEAMRRLLSRFPELQPDPLVGMKLHLDRRCDQEGGCCDRLGTIEAGAAMHAYGVRCPACGKHRGWLRCAAADVLRRLHDEGRLGSRPVLRDTGVVP